MTSKPITGLRLDAPEMILRGHHTTSGAGGTTLSFEVVTVRRGPDDVRAYLNVCTRMERDANPTAGTAQVHATAPDERAALRRLASYLHRCAEAIDDGAASVLLPASEVKSS